MVCFIGMFFLLSGFYEKAHVFNGLLNILLLQYHGVTLDDEF